MTILPSQPLTALSVDDLVTLLYVVSLGISELRLTVSGQSGLDLLRAELRRREWAS